MYLQSKFPTLLFLALATIMFSSCDDSDNQVEPEEPLLTTAEFRITSEVEKIFARTTCEGDGTEQQADIYTKIQMFHRGKNDGELQLLTESLRKDTYLSLGATANFPGISTGRLMTIQDGDVVVFEVEIYEQDPGYRDAEEIFTVLLEYSAADKAWVNSQGKIYDTSEAGEYQFDEVTTFTMEEGARCSIDVTFRVAAERQ